MEGHDCGSYFYVLVLTTDNKIYFTYFAYTDVVNDQNNHLDFEEIVTDYNIVDITKIDYTGFRTCGNHDFGVVLNNGEIRALTGDLPLPTIGKLNYGLVKKVTTYWPSIVVYKDNTISQLLDNPYDGPISNKLLYNGNNLLLDKYINIDNGLESYIISNNKLYKLTWHNEDRWTKLIEKIELVNSSEIAKESLNSLNGKNNYYNNKKNDTITFKNGLVIEIKNIVYVYNNK